MINLFIDGLCIVDVLLINTSFKKVYIYKEIGTCMICVTAIDFEKYRFEFRKEFAVVGDKVYNVKKRGIVDVDG